MSSSIHLLTFYRFIESKMIEIIPTLKANHRTETLKFLEIITPEDTMTSDAHLIAFRNGVYDLETASKPSQPAPQKDLTVIAQEVIAGLWGNGSQRKSALELAGYNFNAVQAKVNEILSGKKPSAPSKTTEQIAKEVLAGQWGNGQDRINRLTSAGYDANAVQNKVNQMVNSKSIDTVAREVIQGKWGNGAERKRRLTQAGYDFNVVQNRVNALL